MTGLQGSEDHNSAALSLRETKSRSRQSGEEVTEQPIKTREPSRNWRRVPRRANGDKLNLWPE